MIIWGRRLGAMVAVFFVLAAPALASAVSGIPDQIVPKECNQPGGCQSVCDIVHLAQNVLNFAIFIGVVLSTFMFAWAGWNSMTSGGNAEQYAKAKRVFGNVLIGLLLIVGGWIVIDTLMNILVGNGSVVTLKIRCN